MTEIQSKKLEEIYQKLHDNIQRKKKKHIDGSIIPMFLDLKSSNLRFSLLSESALPSYKIPKDECEYLLKRGLIRQTDMPGMYTITAKGIWEIEKNKNLMDPEKLIEVLEQKFFEKIYETTEKPLTERERVVLFSMIAVRAFSEKSCVDLQKDEVVIEHWKEILDESYKKLRFWNLVPEMSSEDLYGSSQTEKMVSNLIRHATELRKKTGDIYRTIGHQKYFLDISSGSEVSKEKLRYLFKRIFEEKNLEVEQMNEILDFCHKMATTKNIYIFGDEHIFSKPIFDDLIRDSLMQIWT